MLDYYGPEEGTDFRPVHHLGVAGELAHISGRHNRLPKLARVEKKREASSLGGTTATDVVARAYVEESS